MNLTLHLNEEIEARLKAQAALTGQKPEELALEALREKFAVDSTGPPLSNDQWQRQFNAWIAEQHSRNPQLDDSRGSIYADRD